MRTSLALLAIAFFVVGCSSDDNNDVNANINNSNNQNNVNNVNNSNNANNVNNANNSNNANNANNSNNSNSSNNSNNSNNTNNTNGTTGCVDADMEPNENANDAFVVMSGDAFDAEICDPDDLDVYAVDLQVGDEITVAHTFVNAEGNQDMTACDCRIALGQGWNSATAGTIGPP